MATLTNQATVNYKIQNINLSNISNNSTFDVIAPSLTVVKTNLPTAGITGTNVLFTIVITNTNILFPATNVILTDDLPTAGYTYVTGTAKINNVATLDLPTTGINIGSISALGITTVTFNATVS